jgi:uncharacterized protein (TIGR02594 family)
VAEFSTVIPWVVLLTVFAVMAALVWRGQSQSADLAKVMLQLIGQRPAPIPSVIDVTPVPKPAPLAPPPFLTPARLPAPPPPPKPSGPFAAAPPWFQWALHEIGFHETGNNQGIERYIGLAHCGSLGDPWCAIFFNAAMESSGIPGTRSASSQSPRHDAGYVQLSGPALGAIAVFWRGSQDSGLGHVGFYRGEDADRVWTLGGNENDMVQIEALPKSRSSFGLIGYWWPKSVPLPAIGPVLMPTGSPVHIQTPPAEVGIPASAPTPGLQVGITATMFGGQGSAYGGAIDDNAPGVALPLHFAGERPKVRVTSKKTGQSIECDIVDVGPWNTNDPYWKTGARPQAESGTDMTGRHTNSAGIDLTLAAAKALGIDGKGLVDWSFVESPLAEPSTTPKVT